MQASWEENYFWAMWTVSVFFASERRSYDRVLPADWDSHVPRSSSSPFFGRFRQCCIVYFFVDLVWVSMIPHCVKSPGTIVKVRAHAVHLSTGSFSS
jgi:hypothetical protein